MNPPPYAPPFTRISVQRCSSESTLDATIPAPVQSGVNAAFAADATAPAHVNASRRAGNGATLGVRSAAASSL